MSFQERRYDSTRVECWFTDCRNNILCWLESVGELKVRSRPRLINISQMPLFLLYHMKEVAWHTYIWELFIPTPYTSSRKHKFPITVPNHQNCECIIAYPCMYTLVTYVSSYSSFDYWNTNSNFWRPFPFASYFAILPTLIISHCAVETERCAYKWYTNTN